MGPFRTILLAVLGVAALPAQMRVVLENATVIDGTGRAPIPHASILISEGKIRWIGPRVQLKTPSDAERVDYSGKYIMPGIINLHGHVGSTIGLTQDPKNFTRENVERQLRLYASYGVTSVVSMGSDGDLVYQIRAEQRGGHPTVARIFTAGRGFTGKAGYPSTVPGMKGVPFEVETAAEVQKDVEQLADKRVDLVKIWVDDHLGREKKISPELCRAIIESAHKHGLKVAAHIFYLEDAKMLVESGLNGLAHSVRDAPVDDALIASLKKHGAWQSSATLTREASTFIYLKSNPVLSDPFFTRGLTPDVMQQMSSPEYRKKVGADPDFAKYPGFLATAKKNLKKLFDAGVKIGFGTDTGPPARFQGSFEHWEMEMMADAGLTPPQIITIATKNSAEFLGAKDLGTLEPGRWADLIVLGRNPLDDIRNTRTIQAVWIAGNRVN